MCLARAPCSRRCAERLHPLLPLQVAAHRGLFADSPTGTRTQAVEDPLQALPHDDAPSRDSPKQQAAGSCGSSEHGDADHTVAEPAAAEISRTALRTAGPALAQTAAHGTAAAVSAGLEMNAAAWAVRSGATASTRYAARTYTSLAGFVASLIGVSG